jgi:ATP-dependent Clp protease adapter protein ClpS
LLFVVTLSEHLERARELARRKGHARVSAVHLLASLIGVSAVQRKMTNLGYSLARLDRYLGEALAREPDARRYSQPGFPPRDVREPEIDVSLEPVLANAVMELALFEALIAPLGPSLGFDETRLRRFADEVTAAAAATGHKRALVEHALYVLARRATDEGRFADALERLGYPRRDFRHHIVERIRVGTESMGVSSFAAIRQDAIAHANATGSDVLTTGALVVDLLRASATREALASVGVSHPSLLFSYVHGAVPAPIATIAGPADIVMYADSFTPPEIVADLLIRYFGQPADAAMSMAAALRQHGQQALRVADGRAAAPAVAVVRGECAEQGMPLRIELRAV